MFFLRSWAVGSSPLARGLPNLEGEVLHDVGIIPARAGFTARTAPRCRGRCGSSPLARGLPGELVEDIQLVGIIPARAGFTEAVAAPRPGTPDHPRSRGVYRRDPTAAQQARGSSPLARGLLDLIQKRTCAGGSSPLARGLHAVTRDAPSARGIIPARAGFTGGHLGARDRRWDHPRSRGVYHGDHLHVFGSWGSSPLARGLP